jgi:hypothetical protein
MPTSEARINANRCNAQMSTGPASTEGKAKSRCNSFKHGMTGAGIVVRADDAAEVERRHEALLAEMAPKTLLGELLVREMATLSVRMEQGALYEIATVSRRVRHAADDFDEERLAVAERLMKALADDPRGHLRQLKRSPEGVDLLVLGWSDLRADLAREFEPTWDAASLVTVANLLGIREVDLRGSRIEALSRATLGNFGGLSDTDGAGLAVGARQTWARDRLVERIDEEIAKLDAHLETLDLDAIDRDRAEAGGRALFDASKQATLARRYESAARRGFYKALEELRRVEAEFQAEVQARAEVESKPPVPPAGQARGRLASSCRPALDRPETLVDLAPPPIWPPSATFSSARQPNGEVLTVGNPVRGPA